MKHIKQIVIIVAIVVVAAASYMAYQRYYNAAQNNVKVQGYNNENNPFSPRGWGH